MDRDTLIGGAGNDTIDGTRGGWADVGVDVVTFSGVQSSYTITTNQFTKQTTVIGAEGTDTIKNVEILRFSDGDQILSYNVYANGTLTGNIQDDVLRGSSGNNTFWGLGGNDTIVAGSGNDIIVGGDSIDVLTGGTGPDIFRYTSTSQSNVGPGDILTDFNALTTDVLNLQNLGGGAWNGTITDLTTTAFANIGNIQIGFNDISKSLQIDGDGNGSADMEINLTGVSIGDLDATDFTFI